MSTSKVDQKNRILIDKKTREKTCLKAGDLVIIEPIDDHSFKVNVLDFTPETLEEDPAWQMLQKPAKLRKIRFSREIRKNNGRRNLARISASESKPLAIIDSNVLIYAMIKDYPDKLKHEKCLALLESGLKGQLNYILTVNPIIMVEVFSVLRNLLGCEEAEFRINTLLHSRRLGFLSISKEACQNSVQWAKEKNIPVNDALIAASMGQSAELIFTVDELHFKKLEEHITVLNPVSETL